MLRSVTSPASALALALWCAVLPAQGQEQAPPAPEERFPILEYRVLGNSMLPVKDVERAVYPHLGTSRVLADVEQARQALELAYRNAGYGTVFVDIPEQNVENGIVRLRVTEGRIDRVHVTGARYVSQRKILASMPAVQKDAVLHLPSLQAELTALNGETAERSVTPILKAGRNPGTVDLELRVNDKFPVHASLEVNDRYTADTTRLRANANLTYTNLFQKRHALSLQYQTSPRDMDEVEVLAGTYSVPWGGGRNSIILSAIHSDTDVAALGTLGVLGRGNIFGLKSAWTLPHGGWIHSIVAGVDYKDVQEIIMPEPSDDDDEDPAAVNRPIDYLTWSVVHTAIRRSGRLGFMSSLGAYFGTRRLMNDYEEFRLKRAGLKASAPPNFFYFRGNLQLDVPLWWGFEIGSRVSAQYSPTALISNEQFSIGGVDTVRGFLEADQFGDYGAAGTLELRTPSLLPRSTQSVLTFFLFGDAGVVRLADALPGQSLSEDLSSAGAGLRFSGLSGLEAALDWAYPLVPSTRTEAHDSRVHFSFKYGF
jgi:hemolysin activation/secretion protein